MRRLFGLCVTDILPQVELQDILGLLLRVLCLSVKDLIKAFSLHEDHGDEGCWQRKEAGPREDGSCACSGHVLEAALHLHTAEGKSR